MNKNPASQSGLFNPRILVALALCSVGVLLTMFSFAATPSSGTIPQPTTITVGKKEGVAWSDTGKVGVRLSEGSSPWQAAQACLTTPSAQCDVFTLTFSAASNFWTAVAGPPLTGHIHTRLVQPDANTQIDLIVFDAQKNPACFSYPGRPGPEDISCDIQRPTPTPATYSVVAYYEAGDGTHGYTATSDLYIENDAAPNTVENNAITFGPATWVDLQRVTGADPMVGLDMRGNGRVFVAFPWARISSSPTGGSVQLPNIVARSLDRGETFRVLFDETCPTSNSQPFCGDTGFGHCTISLSPDTDYVYLAGFGQPADTNTPIQVSANGGDTWPVDSQVPFVPLVGDPWVLAGPGQTAYVAESSGTYNELYATTQNGGTTWSANFMPNGYWNTNVAYATQPIMDRRPAQIPGGGNIYQAFAEQTNNAIVVNVPVVGIAVSTDATQHFTSFDVGADLPFVNNNVDTYQWVAVDSAGNLYAVWWTLSGSDVVLSTSPISDPANDPSSIPPGKPGTKWTNPVRVSTGAAQTAVVSNIVAGSPGNVAVVYWGTDGYGFPNSQSSTAKWYAFVAHSSNALDPSPSFTQSKISERFIHTGDICTQHPDPCTSGNATTDRALRNNMSVGYDPDGRLYAAWSEANNNGNRTEIRFAKQLTGPSLFAGTPDFHDPAPSSPMSDPSGDATWLNRISGGTNLPGADITRLAVTNDATTIQFALSVADATQFQQAINTVSAASAVPTDRLLFLVRFETADQEYFAAYEYSSGLTTPTTRAFTGRILGSDGIENGTFTEAIDFVAHDPATATVSGNTITITQNLSALGNPWKLLSVVGATLIGPSESNETQAKLLNTVDATRAFDYTLSGIPRVVSRMIHGSAGTFDIDLPLTGSPGIECRSGGANGSYQMVFTFPNTLTHVDGASVTSGTSSVSSAIDSSDAHNYIVNLTGVSNAQYLTVTLNNILDSQNNTGNVSATMGVLIGDVNATGLVNGNDVSAVQGQARQTANSTNFRLDVNTTGLIDGNDVSLVQSKTRTSLPSPP